jgi:hypothetical protein
MEEKKYQRKQLDWESIEKHYRAGKLSIREIGQCGCDEKQIRRRAGAEGWVRDLSEKINEAVRNKVVRSSVRITDPTEREIVESASNEGAAVLTLQRKDIIALREFEEKLLEELAGEPTKLYITQYQGQIVQKVIGLTVTERAQTLQILSSVRERRINLERQAWGIDDKRGGDGLPVVMIHDPEVGTYAEGSAPDGDDA